MMMKLLLVIQFIIIYTFLSKAQFTSEWLRKVPRELGSWDDIYTACDRWGNIYIGMQDYQVFNSPASLIYKYDDDGTLVGQYFFPANFHIKDLEVNSQDQIVFTGSHYGNIQIGSQSFVNTSANTSNAFLGVFDTDFNLIWGESFGGALYDSGNGLVTDASDNIYVCGAVAGNVQIKDTSLACSHNSNAFLSKFSADGDLQWVKVDTGAGGSYATSVMINSNNELLLGGGMDHNPITIDGITLSPGPDPFGYTYYTAFLIKFSAAHIPEWGKSLDNQYNVWAFTMGFDSRNAIISFLHGWQDELFSFISIYDHNGEKVKSATYHGINGISTVKDSIYVLASLDKIHYGFGIFYRPSIIATLRDTGIVTLDTCFGNPVAISLIKDQNNNYLLTGVYHKKMWFGSDTITTDPDGYNSYEHYPFILKLRKDDSLLLSNSELIRSNFLVYPVPAEDELNIYFREGYEHDVSVRLLNSLGQAFFTKTLNPPTMGQLQRIPLNSVAGGIYFVEVSSGASRRTVKVVVK